VSLSFVRQQSPSSANHSRGRSRCQSNGAENSQNSGLEILHYFFSLVGGFNRPSACQRANMKRVSKEKRPQEACPEAVLRRARNYLVANPPIAIWRPGPAGPNPIAIPTPAPPPAVAVSVAMPVTMVPVVPMAMMTVVAAMTVTVTSMASVTMVTMTSMAVMAMTAVAMTAVAMVTMTSMAVMAMTAVAMTAVAMTGERSW
jgi:hypothetical protein